MYDTSTERRDPSDEEAPSFDISDTALEAAAGEIKYKAAVKRFRSVPALTRARLDGGAAPSIRCLNAVIVH